MKTQVPGMSFYIVFGFLAMTLVCGCANLISRPSDSLRIISTEPASPAVLKLGEKMTVNVQYCITNSDAVLIFVRPFTKGEKTDGYRAHPSLTYRLGSGIIVGWFYFDTEADVDEVRAEMIDARTHALVTNTSLRMRATWK
jgi:hypothetical protein